jgi:MFS transporter, OFA family, oxalate/formate antiporter
VADYRARSAHLIRQGPRWGVVLAAFTLMFMGFGAVYSFAAFFTAFQSEFDASRANVSLVFSLSALLWFSAGVPGGMLADRFGPRGVCLAGALFLAGGLALAANAPSVELLYLTYSIGVGLGIGLSYVPSVAAVQQAFVTHRGLASGIAVSGIGAGNLVIPLAAAWLIGLIGWRHAYLTLAAAMLVLSVPAALALGGRKSVRKGVDGAPLPGMSLSEGLRSAPFWLMYGVTLPICVGFFVPMVHLVPYALDAGLTEAQGVSLVSLLGLGSLLGRFFVGGIADRLGHMRSLMAISAGLGLMFLLWWMSKSYLPLAVFAVVFGSLYGGYVALAPTVCMDIFGPRALSAIIGSLYTAAGLGTLVGPTFAGATFDATGSYDLSILACAVLSFASAGLALAMRRHLPRRHA